MIAGSCSSVMALLLALGATPPDRLTRTDAEAEAARQSPELAQARAETAAATARRSTAAELPNPTLGFSAGPDEPRISGTVDQKLPIFGQRGSAIAAAEAEIDTARAAEAQGALRVKVAVDRAYTAAVLAKLQLALAQDAARIARELAEANKQKFAAGLASELDAEQAQLPARRADREVRDRESASIAARWHLAELLGRNDAPDPSDPLTPLPANPAPGTTSLAVQVAARTEHAAELAADRERAAVRPVPEVTLELERLDAEPHFGVRGSIAFDLPLLSQRGGAIAEQLANADRAKGQLRAAELRSASTSRAARARFEAARDRAQFLEQELVPEAERVQRLARAAFALGRAPLVSVLQADADLNHARVDAADAAAAAWDALADLEEAGAQAP